MFEMVEKPGGADCREGVRQLVVWAPEGDVPGNVPGSVRHFGWLRRASFLVWK